MAAAPASVATRISGSRPRFLEPGLRRLDPGVERYPISARGSVVIQLHPGDELRIVDVEGGQRCELVVFAGGRSDAGVIGATATGPPKGLLKQLEDAGEPGRALFASLSRRGLELDQAQAVYLFGEDATPGTEARYTAQGQAICIIAAPGGRRRLGR